MWLKGVKLKPEHRARLYTKQIQILSRGPQSQKERRAREIKEIVKEASNEIKLPLSSEAHRLIGVGLYWAEGSKGKMFQITNSDPYLILFMVRWIEKIFSISVETLRARLNIYPQQGDLKIKKFWSNLTGIPLKNFKKSYIKPLSTGYKKNNLYYGTIRIEVPKSANFVCKTFGWVQGLLADIKPQVDFVQKKWRHLSKVPRPVNLNPPIA
ncbi:hypothetical protein A3B26_02650 [Candidatus Giovannonibacteria bacterium RIFCSPLOWO2_01_FULL_48_47]|nr:MAG: hypothetical protein A3D61_01225 [Candidatus Giovannonibacteria bacterium RIFCSPHIGHO2_02_FULL_48_15]OGF89613.1 MAG: hypothetical protein A3B26_02650 [Candidatus Giovannonibacteria bacterium RIFCSPLOWO2_01_FULL_48_47]OGF95058.1 MAG: hypothetical protein A2433_00180 [Candidatus Giovannonibacteria bacterium RIFOXYC1_FULL_48_8]HBT81714.1 hypothetical protein [Candidatus Giovannonibacteria bacterium]